MRAPAGARCVVRGPARWSGAAARVERSMSLRQGRRALLDRYIRIPTVSREVSPDLVDDVRGFWRGVGIDLEPLRGTAEEGTPGCLPSYPDRRVLRRSCSMVTTMCSRPAIRTCGCGTRRAASPLCRTTF